MLESLGLSAACCMLRAASPWGARASIGFEFVHMKVASAKFRSLLLLLLIAYARLKLKLCKQSEAVRYGGGAREALVNVEVTLAEPPCRYVLRGAEALRGGAKAKSSDAVEPRSVPAHTPCSGQRRLSRVGERGSVDRSSSPGAGCGIVKQQRGALVGCVCAYYGERSGERELSQAASDLRSGLRPEASGREALGL
ncbi:hypothetical protein C8Q70DRAFT_937942 [Cubamyces menziesii]|nr:hypothetical protein C8Q70DRAFT_937942 [Cubamyces menziesii]